MKQLEAKQLIPEISHVKYAGGKYRVAEIKTMPGNAIFIGIYDEPPSLHVDYLNADNVEFVKEWLDESHTSTDTGHGEKCNHDWQEYKQCCYCGAFESFRGEIIDRRTQGNIEAIRLAFIDWWMGCKDTNGNNPPLAIQVFHWFDTHVGIFVSDTSPRVMNLESIIRLKENERQEWADMCIKKQARIEQLEEKILIMQQQPK